MMALASLAVKVAIVLAAALLACGLFRRRSASARHWVLTAAFAAAAGLPALGPLAPEWRLMSPPVIAREAGGTGRADASASTAMPASDRVATRASAARPVPDAMSLRGVLGRLWIAGVVGCALVLGAGMARLAWLASRARRITSGRWPELAREVRRVTGLRRQIRLLHGPQPALLVTWGLTRPTILLPSTAVHWSDDRIRIVLAHEMAHIRRHDWLVLLVAQAVLALHWFNPLAWIACRRLRDESERACDDEVIAGGVQPSVYATHLVELARLFATGRAWSATPAMAQPCSLERRIVAMLNARVNRSRVSGSFRAATAAAAVGIAIVLAGAAFAQPETARLSGTVTDPSGAPLPDATVTVTHKQTTAGHAIPTDQAGTFSFAALPAGDYTFETRAAGFDSVKETIELRPGDSMQRDLRLKIGTVQESITVRGSSAEPRVTAKAPGAVAGIVEKIKGWRLQPPLKVKDVRPVYTQALVDAGIEGQVVLDSQIAIDGSVTDIRVVSSAHDELTRAARDAASQWRFEPTRLWGTPTETRMTMTFNFQRQP